MHTSVQLDGLQVRYPNFELGPIDIEIHPGERVALVGANGAGKSTTLKAIAGRLPTYEGHARFAGAEIRDQVPQVREAIGYLPERVLGFGWMTVSEHLAFLSNFFGTWDAAYAADLLARLRLPAASKVGTLSKGMQVKLALIAAEAFRPPVLLLDEPTSGIDPVMRGELLDVINDCAPPGGDRLVVYSSHILEDVEQVSSRVIMLREGRIVGDLSAAELQAMDPEASLSRILYSELSHDA